MTTTIVYDECKDVPEIAKSAIIATYSGDAVAERDELEKGQEAYNAVVSYMLGIGYTEEPLEFLRCWNEGDFESLRKEWPDAPAEIYYADSTNKQ